MPHASDHRLHPSQADVPHADPRISPSRRTVDLDTLIEDYPWVRRDEVLTIDGRRFFI